MLGKLLKHEFKATARTMLPMFGVVLVLSPMTASRLMFALCGIVLIAVGAGLIWDRFRYRKLDSGDDDPNIIDAL